MKHLHILSDARALITAICAGLAFGAYMALADAAIFSSVIPASQVELVSQLSATERIAYFTLPSIYDELLFRLVVMSSLVWFLTKLAGQRAWCFWVAILVAALIVYPAVHLTYLSALAPTPMTVTREVALHGAAGTLWGYIYWRYGLVAAIAGHVSAHVSLEPLLSLLKF